MSYIRTKDGIFEIIKQNNSCVMVKGKYLEKECKLKRKEDKQADTIEELCDEFVIIRGDCKCLYKPRDIFDCQDKNAVNDLIKNNQIYGAIWVFDSNGAPTLKPVAKMNDKGDLELL